MVTNVALRKTALQAGVMLRFRSRRACTGFFRGGAQFTCNAVSVTLEDYCQSSLFVSKCSSLFQLDCLRPVPTRPRAAAGTTSPGGDAVGPCCLPCRSVPQRRLLMLRGAAGAARGPCVRLSGEQVGTAAGESQLLRY